MLSRETVCKCFGLGSASGACLSFGGIGILCSCTGFGLILIAGGIAILAGSIINIDSL